MVCWCCAPSVMRMSDRGAVTADPCIGCHGVVVGITSLRGELICGSKETCHCLLWSPCECMLWVSGGAHMVGHRYGRLVRSDEIFFCSVTA